MVRILDIVALAGIAGGLGLVLQPWWPDGLRVGFFATLASTVLHIVTSHLNKAEAQ